MNSANKTAMPASQLLTPNHIAYLFGVSLITVHNWRKGTPTRGKLEVAPVKGSPRSIGMKVSEVKAFAKRNGFTLTCNPQSLLSITQANKPAKAVKALTTQKQGKASKTPALAKKSAIKPVTRSSSRASQSPATV